MIGRIFKDSRLSVLWLIIRLYAGYEWITAGFEKFTDPKGAWVGATAGSGLKGFVSGAIGKAGGAHPMVQGWYASFLKNVMLPSVPVFTYLVPLGEFLTGLCLITGTVTLFAAFIGAFMNLNFMLAGSTSTNPVLYTMAVLLLFAGVNAGRYGVDGFLASRKAKAGGATSAA